MKLKAQFLTLIFLIGAISQTGYSQETKSGHATFSAFSTAGDSGTVYKVERIVSYGICASVEYRRVEVPGGHRQALVDYEEHISIPILTEEFQYVDAYDQFGDPVPAFFIWEGKTFETTPCPIQYIVPPPSTLLYQAPASLIISNTSNRAEVTEDNPAIAGFVLTESTWVIIRGIGPSMNLESPYIDDPVITLHADEYLLDDLNDDLENSISNDNWANTMRRETLEFWEMAPGNENESALVTYLNPGAYTVHLSSNGELGSGLVEVYLAPYSLPIR